MNYRNVSYPQDTNFMIQSCQTIVSDIEKMLSTTSNKKLYLNDFYQQNGNENKAFRSELRKIFNLNSTNKKYPGKEIKGIYVFAEEIDGVAKPFYIGMSQTVIRRLRQHVFGTGHNQATLAYLMARTEYNTKENSQYKGTRQDLQYFINHRERFQKEIRNARFAIKEIDDDYLMYMAEVFTACHFRCKWNSFETH